MTGTELLEHGVDGSTLAAQLASVIMQTGFKDREKETAIGKVLLQAKACWERGDYGEPILAQRFGGKGHAENAAIRDRGGLTWKECCKSVLGIEYLQALRYMKEVSEPGYLTKRSKIDGDRQRIRGGGVSTVAGVLGWLRRAWGVFPEGHHEIVELVLDLYKREVKHDTTEQTARLDESSADCVPERRDSDCGERCPLPPRPAALDSSLSDGEIIERVTAGQYRSQWRRDGSPHHL